MRKFTIKFIVIALMFLAPAGYYRFFIEENESGDIGVLGRIPFGKEYAGLDVSWYDRGSLDNGGVVDVYDRDSLKMFPIITIGDSFSQMKNDGYQYGLSSRTGVPIANFQTPLHMEGPDCYMALINEGVLKEGQTVILECVERDVIERFSRLDTLAKFNNEAAGVNMYLENESTEPFLNRYLSWIRLQVNFQNPIKRYPLTQECFTHPRFPSTLHAYHRDVIWQDLSADQFERAGRNMEKILDISEKNGINIIILIATDKYDAYEPWIAVGHEENPTLSRIPEDPRISDPRPVLRSAIERGIKDVYKLNNTHWSTVGADIVADNLFEAIDSMGYLPE